MSNYKYKTILTIDKTSQRNYTNFV